MAPDDKSGKRRNPWERPGDNNGGGNPWGSGGGGHRGGGGSEPPDLDEMLRRAQENFRNVMPGGMSGGKVAGILAVAVVALWLASGLYTIDPGEQGVIQRFGAWSRTQTEAGLGYRFPAPFESITKVKVNQIRLLNVGFMEAYSKAGAAARRDIPEESLMLTSDRNIVDLNLIIQWNIKSAEDYLFNIEDQEATIKKVAESAIREVVGQTDMFQIITSKRKEVADRTKEILQENLDEYKSGVNITQALIEKAEVHPDVQSAFQDVQSAKQDAEDVQNRAGAYRQDILPKARGRAIQMKQEAEGYKQTAIARATGDADRFNAVLEAYQSGKDVTKERLYIETMESVLRNAQKVILDGKSAQGVVPYLPLGELNKTKPQQVEPSAGAAQGLQP
ncbi:MAG: FtsH protease activity modulator HflK [Alphaproteobacteria bacterium]|nr:FtsH protease activity modulator HflK [Alphaproteobacteria bacterium]